MPHNVFFAEDMRKLEDGLKIGQIAQDVSMTIDHPRHDEGVGKIDHSHARGRFIADALDPMVLDRDENIFLRSFRF